jgi:galactokinase/mevalonate kinase-like predicted kinase
MLGNMVNQSILDLIQQYADTACGWKLSGAGGGGYLVLVSERPIEHAVRIVVRREAD